MYSLPRPFNVFPLFQMSYPGLKTLFPPWPISYNFLLPTPLTPLSSSDPLTSSPWQFMFFLHGIFFP